MQKRRYFAKRETQSKPKTLWLLLALACLIGAILAQMVNTSQAAAATLNVVEPKGKSLSLEINKGRLIRLARPASEVFIADPEVADIQVKSPRLIYVFGKRSGETTLYAVDARERVLANVDVRVTHNLSRLRDAISKLGPNMRDVNATSIDGALVLDGIVRNATDAENLNRLAASFVGEGGSLINRVGLEAPNQVNLRVRVAEVSKDVDKQFGFNWSLVGDISGFALGLSTTNPFGAAAALTSTLTASNSAGALDVNATVDALQGEGLVTILAEPNLTAMSGETASFLAGGEFPILVPGDDGSVSIEFKQFGVSLAFTPTIIGDARINLHVRPEVSQLSSTNSVSLGGFEVPSLTTRRAETTVELGSGQSFAIAGLLQNDVTHSTSEVPGLGEIPVLGGLFRSDSFQREESELVIIVTPYLVRPPATKRLAGPTDGYQAPHDIERIIGGADYRRADQVDAGGAVDRAGGRLYGPVGFQLD